MRTTTPCRPLTYVKSVFFYLLVGIPGCASLPLHVTGKREGSAFTEPFKQIEKMIFTVSTFMWPLKNIFLWSANSELSRLGEFFKTKKYFLWPTKRQFFGSCPGVRVGRRFCVLPTCRHRNASNDTRARARSCGCALGCYIKLSVLNSFRNGLVLQMPIHYFKKFKFG